MRPVSQKPAAAPPQPSDGKPSRIVAATVESCRRRMAFQDLLARLLGLSAAAVLFPLLVVIVDHLWPDGLPQRIVAGAAVGWAVAVVLTLLFLVVQAGRRRINPLFAARHVERARGIRHNTLVNALLLRKEPRLAYAAEAAQRQAASDVESHFADVFETRTASRTPALALGLTLAVWALYAVVSPKSVWTSLARFFGADLIAPTATRIEMMLPRPGDIVHAGEPLPIEFAIAGRRVDAAWFDVLAAPGSKLQRVARYPLRADANASTAGRWRLTLAPHEVAGRIRFRCVAGDATLDGTIDALPQPTLSDLAVHLVPPAHTGLPSGSAPQPNLRVEAGSRATFSVRANVEIYNPVFVLRGESETRTRMTVDRASPSSAALVLVLSERGEYWIEFTDRWGYSNRNPTRYRIDVRPDGAPRVAIVSPARRAAPDDRIDITRFEQLVARAEDDFHISELVVVSDANGSVERSIVPSATAADELTARREAGVATEDLVRSAGQPVRVWFEARDNRVLPDGTPAPQTARSRVLTLFKPKEISKRARSRRDASSDAAQASSQGGDLAQPRENSTGDAHSAQPGDEPGTAAPRPESNTSDDSRPDSSDPGSEGEPSDPLGAADAEASGNQEESGVGGADPNAGEESESAGGGEALEDAVERFLEEHGEDVREIRRRLEERGEPSAADGPRSGEDEPSESQAEAGDESERSSGGGARKESSDSNRPGDSGAEDSKNERPTDDARPDESTPKDGNDQGASAEERESPESKGETGDEEPNAGNDPPDSGGESAEEGATEKERSRSSSTPDKSETKPQPDNDTNEFPNEQPESTREGASSDESRPPDEQGSEAPTGKGADQDAGQGGSSGQTKEPTERKTGQGGKEPSETGEQGEMSGEKGDRDGADPPRPESEESGQEPPGDQDADEGASRESGSEPGSDGESPGAESKEQGPASGSTPPTGSASDRQGQRLQDGAGESPGAGARSAGGGEARIAPRPDDDPARDEPGEQDAANAEDSDSKRLESQGRRDVLDVLQLLERAELDLDTLLDELDWDAEKAETFVRALKRLRELAARGGASRPPRVQRHDAALGESGVQTGRELTSDASMGAREAQAGDDTLRRIAPPAEQNISPALRHVLDAYYRSLAARQKASELEQRKP